MKYMFETERLRVRRFEKEDALRLYEYHLDDAVKKWIPNESYADIEEAAGAVDFFAYRVDRGQLPYVLAVELKHTGELIGDTGVNEVDGKPDELEIGYVISQNHSGKGYATELVDAMTEFISGTFGAKTLYGRVMHGNAASVRVLEKNGYEFVTEDFGAEDDPYGNGMLVYKKQYGTVFIETKRLQIKEWSEELADAAYTISQDESNRQYLPDEVFASVDEAQGWIRELLNNREKCDEAQIFPVILKNGELIGHVGICPLEDWNENAWEIEYHISEAYRGQGYAVEAVNAFVPIIMERFHLHNLRGCCPQDNMASVRVMERCGFHKYRENDVRYYGKPTRLLYYIYEE